MATVGNDLSVLICDDSTSIRKKLRSTLEKCKCKEIFEAVNGNLAEELVKTRHV